MEDNPLENLGTMRVDRCAVANTLDPNSIAICVINVEDNCVLTLDIHTKMASALATDLLDASRTAKAFRKQDAALMTDILSDLTYKKTVSLVIDGVVATSDEDQNLGFLVGGAILTCDLSQTSKVELEAGARRLEWLAAQKS